MNDVYLRVCVCVCVRVQGLCLNGDYHSFVMNLSVYYAQTETSKADSAHANTPFLLPVNTKANDSYLQKMR